MTHASDTYTGQAKFRRLDELQKEYCCQIQALPFERTTS